MRWALLFLLLVSCEGDEMRKSMHYGDGGNALLESPAGFTRSLQHAKPETLQWKTRDGRALELEVQIQVVQLNGLPPATIGTNLFWQLRAHGHGDSQYEYPPEATIAPNGVLLPNWALPPRGVRIRIAARELELFVMSDSVGATPLIRASIQPVASPHVPIFPTLGSGARGGNFPMGANEWRLAGAPALTAVNLHDFSGAVLAVGIVADFEDWSVIPLNATAWFVPSGEAVGIYR